MTATRDDEVAELRRANAELQQRLDEALDQQTATAEVLQVINSSPGDLAPVFDAMLERAMRLCEAAHGYLYRFHDGVIHPVAVRGETKFVEWMEKRGAYRPSQGSHVRKLMNGALIHYADVRTEPSYTMPETPRRKT